MLVDGILKELGDGNNVNIDNFGTFSVNAERYGSTATDIRAESIHVKRIVFKPSEPLLKQPSFMFQRLPKGIVKIGESNNP